MLIEIIGCTGAGKTTLIRRILHNCQKQGIDVSRGDDIVLKKFRLHWFKSQLPRALMVNVLALFACLITWRNNHKLYLFATRFLLKLPIARVEKIGVLRNVLKKIGIYEIIRSRDTDRRIILMDEGTLHIAHNLFVHDSIQVTTEHLERFVKMIPFPDVFVYLRQPESLLIERTMKRGHKRISDRSYDNVVHFIKQAVTTFDKLVQYPEVENRLLLVNGGQQVTIAAHGQNNPFIIPALKIVQSGINEKIYEPPRVGTKSTATGF